MPDSRRFFGPGKQESVRFLAQRKPEDTLRAIADKLMSGKSLNEQVPEEDPETWKPEIRRAIDRGQRVLLAAAQADYSSYERLRAEARRVRGRADPVICVLAGAGAAYLFLVAEGPQFLPAPAAEASSHLGLTPLIVAVLAVAVAIRWVPWQRRRARLAYLAVTAGLRWEAALENRALRPFVAKEVNERNRRLFDTSIGEFAPRFIEESEPRMAQTGEVTRVLDTAWSVRSGSVGISGPRGAGKSSVLKFFMEEISGRPGIPSLLGEAPGDPDEIPASGQGIRLLVSAPVEYETRAFILHLFTKLCQAVLDSGDVPAGIAAETRRSQMKLKYLRTTSMNWSASLAPRTFLTLARGHARQLAEQPVTLPELVDDFRTYVKLVAGWQKSGGGWGRLIIGIDEADRIRDGDRAEAFLNDIKAVFGTPGSLYLVALSEDAITGFASRTPSIRSSFDSAFDEIVPMGPVTYPYSEQMLFKRVTGMPRPFIALCHVLAAGLPRDLVREARALVNATTGTGRETKKLPDTAARLILAEIESLRQVSVRRLGENCTPMQVLLHGHQWPGGTPREFIDSAKEIADTARCAEDDTVAQLRRELIVSLSFYATVMEAFGPARLDGLVTCLRNQEYAIIDDLAATRYAMRTNTSLAHQLLEEYRKTNKMGPGLETA
jgi:hypothetical protein